MRADTGMVEQDGTGTFKPNFDLTPSGKIISNPMLKNNLEIEHSPDSETHASNLIPMSHLTKPTRNLNLVKICDVATHYNEEDQETIGVVSAQSLSKNGRDTDSTKRWYLVQDILKINPKRIK